MVLDNRYTRNDSRYLGFARIRNASSAPRLRGGPVVWVAVAVVLCAAALGCSGQTADSGRPAEAASGQSVTAPPQQEIEIRAIPADQLLPRRNREVVKAVRFQEMKELPPEWHCLGASVSFDSEGIHCVAREKAGPILVMNGPRMDASTVDGVAIDMQLRVDGVVARPQRLRFFWFRSGDPRQPGNNWPFSESRQVLFEPGQAGTEEQQVARMQDHSDWKGEIEGAFVEVTIPDALWRPDAPCEVVMRSLQYWKDAAPAGPVKP